MEWSLDGIITAIGEALKTAVTGIGEDLANSIFEALANHELYLDVPEEVVAQYKATLTERILEVGRELEFKKRIFMYARSVKL